MNIFVLLLFAAISPIAALYSLESSRKGLTEKLDIRALLLAAKTSAIASYVFFAVSAVLLFFCVEKDILALIADCFVITLGYIAALTDFFTRRVPNKLILTMIGIGLFLTLVRVFVDFEYGMEALTESVIGFLVGAGLMLIVYIVSRKGLGAGDVKFMGAAGLFLTYRWVLAVMFAGGVLCLISAIALMLMKKIKLTDTLPLIPFLYLGILLVIFLR